MIEDMHGYGDWILSELLLPGFLEKVPIGGPAINICTALALDSMTNKLF